MNIEFIQQFLAWSLVINIAILAVSSIMLVVLRDTITNIHSKFSGVPKTQLPGEYFRYIANFKVAIIVFNLTPYLALRIIT